MLVSAILVQSLRNFTVGNFIICLFCSPICSVYLKPKARTGYSKIRKIHGNQHSKHIPDPVNSKHKTTSTTISYPESSGSLASDWRPGETLGTRLQAGVIGTDRGASTSKDTCISASTRKILL